MEDKRILESEELENISGGLQELPEGVDTGDQSLKSLISKTAEIVRGKDRPGTGFMSRNMEEVELISTTAGKDRPGTPS